MDFTLTVRLSIVPRRRLYAPITRARLTRELFDKENAPIVFGWLLAGHQLGASAIVFEAGAVRTVLGDDYIPVLLSGGLCIVAALLVLRIGHSTALDGLATATA